MSGKELHYRITPRSELTGEERQALAVTLMEWCKEECDSGTAAFIDNYGALGHLMLGEPSPAIRLTVMSTWHNRATLEGVWQDLVGQWVDDISIDDDSPSSEA